MYAKRKYKLFLKKRQGTEICIHEGIKLALPFFSSGSIIRSQMEDLDFLLIGCIYKQWP